ncbi:asparagine synthase (glutamine-hydrolyzing) [Streptosporangium sp. NPDC023963]|uniref:asparagine synthase (glutamine-hydrolyzing) n=1 Tax=Streptosporangium sp. NPDC023963 TaxID=3155608 RepID=UPI00341951FA
MCGITGWVDFDRDLTRERDLLRAMTETMACRGPDDAGVWADTHAGIGHRRLAVIDIEGGAQPMKAERDGRVVAVLTYSGEVYNYRELREELKARGHRFHTASDTEVVLAAYLEWGENCADRLNGMFAFGVWDVERQELVLVRDRLGVKPLYYHPTPAGVLFGSEPKALLANPLVRRGMDIDGLREVLTFTRIPGRTVYQGMLEVLPGQVVKVGRNGLISRRYWRLEARPHTDDLETTVETVRGLLEDIVERQLVSDVPLCVLLSGGLDSSVLTALAARKLGARGELVRSFAVDFVGQGEGFTADDMRGTLDAPFVAEVARHVGSEHTDIELDAARLADPSVRRAVLNSRDVPIGLSDMDASLYLLFKAISAHSTVAISGESADELFGGYIWFHDPNVINAPVFPWAAYGSMDHTALFDLGLLQKLDLQNYLAERYHEALAEVPRLEGETGLERRMREISHLHLSRFLQLMLDRKDRTSMACGLEVRVPFCDHRLVEYVFNVPWAMKTHDGREKSLLRAATADLLPRSVLDRRKSPYPSTQNPAYDQAANEELGRVLADPNSPLYPLLDQEKARLRADGRGPGGRMERNLLDNTLQMNTWLDSYGITLDV